MKNLGSTQRAQAFKMNVEIQIAAAEYRKLRELMIERDQEGKFRDWHRGKLITFTKEVLHYEETEIAKEVQQGFQGDS